MTETAVKREKTIPAYFRKAAGAYGDSPAVTDEQGTFTYRELEKISDNIAGFLHNGGVMPGSVVALLMERSKESVAAMLGILKAGCVYMYVDKKYPNTRKTYMLEDSGAKLVICDAVFDAEFLDGQQGKAVPVSFGQAAEQADDAGHISDTEGAYLIYTSGSTGKPKGLMIGHGNFISLYEAWGREHFALPEQFGLNGQKGHQQVHTAVLAPFGFDMCVLMIYASLFGGHHLHILSEESKQSGQGILGFLNRHRIDIMDATPNYLRLMDDFLEHHVREELAVKRIFCIGDVLSYGLAKKIIARAKEPLFQLYNTYGPAECTVLMTSFVLNKENIGQLKEVPIGTPTENSAVKIVDEGLNEVPGGEVGELVILGECVGMGYISRHIKGKGAFGQLGSRSYRTGDLVRRDRSGELYFIGRADRQCKINGYRVELEEIEKELESFEEIREARVLVKKEDDRFTRLYAFYTGKKAVRVRERLKEKLPYYMVPQEIRYCREFPVNANGKIDYQVLLAEADKSKAQGEEIGEAALQAVRRLLGKERVDLERSFFEEGGDSITLLALISEISEGFCVKPDISGLYACGSIREMVELFRSFPAASEPEKEEEEVRWEHALIAPQKKLYSLEKKDRKQGLSHRDGLGYSLLFKLTFAKPVEEEKLEQCMYKVMQNNEVFLLGLKRQGSRVLNYKKEALPVLKIRQGGREEQVLDELSVFSFTDDMFLEVVRYGERTVYLNVKHIYMDFISVQFFLDDVIRLYTGEEKLSERIGFFTYLSRNRFEEEVLRYWQEKLALCPKRTKLPAERSGAAEFQICRRTCDSAVYRELKEQSKKQSASLFTIVLYYFLRTVRTYSKTEYLRIGCYCPGRNYEIDNGVMGMFTNVLPFVCEGGEKTLHLEAVKREVAEMLQNQNVSQAALYQSMPLEEIADGELFDICFNYQNDWVCLEGQTEVERIETVNVNPDITNRNFYFGVVEENAGMRWEIRYNQGNFSERYVETFIARMQEEILYGTGKSCS